MSKRYALYYHKHRYYYKNSYLPLLPTYPRPTPPFLLLVINNADTWRITLYTLERRSWGRTSVFPCHWLQFQCCYPQIIWMNVKQSVVIFANSMYFQWQESWWKQMHALSCVILVLCTLYKLCMYNYTITFLY